MTLLQDTTEPFMPDPAPVPPPLLEAPLVPPVRGPRQEVDRVDALSCRAFATRRIDTRLVCDYHEREVLLAYWATDANLILHDVSESEARDRDLHCGDTYTPEVTS